MISNYIVKLRVYAKYDFGAKQNDLQPTQLLFTLLLVYVGLINLFIAQLVQYYFITGYGRMSPII